MHISVCIDSPAEPAFHALKHGMEYLLQHPHEPIIYAKNILQKNSNLHQHFFKSGDVEINKSQEYSNFIHTYCDTDHAIYIYDR